MDVDPNYDPSDFLLAGLPPRAEKVEVDKIQDDLAVSESEDEIETVDEPLKQEQENQQPNPSEDDVAGDLWF